MCGPVPQGCRSVDFIAWVHMSATNSCSEWSRFDFQATGSLYGCFSCAITMLQQVHMSEVKPHYDFIVECHCLKQDPTTSLLLNATREIKLTNLLAGWSSIRRSNARKPIKKTSNPIPEPLLYKGAPTTQWIISQDDSILNPRQKTFEILVPFPLEIMTYKKFSFIPHTGKLVKNSSCTEFFY